MQAGQLEGVLDAQWGSSATSVALDPENVALREFIAWRDHMKQHRSGCTRQRFLSLRSAGLILAAWVRVRPNDKPPGTGTFAGVRLNAAEYVVQREASQHRVQAVVFHYG